MPFLSPIPHTKVGQQRRSPFRDREVGCVPERLEQQLERILDALRRKELTAPAGLIARLEGAILGARAIATRDRRYGEASKKRRDRSDVDPVE